MNEKEREKIKKQKTKLWGRLRRNPSFSPPPLWPGLFRVYLPNAESQTEFGFKSQLPLLTFVNVNSITAFFDFFMVRCSIRCFWVRKVVSGAGLV